MASDPTRRRLREAVTRSQITELRVAPRIDAKGARMRTFARGSHWSAVSCAWCALMVESAEDWVQLAGTMYHAACFAERWRVLRLRVPVNHPVEEVPVSRNRHRGGRLHEAIGLRHAWEN